jgi:hypothetical protein
MNKLLRNVLGDTNNNQHRTALANNGKVFNGSSSYNYIPNFVKFDKEQAHSACIVCSITALPISTFPYQGCLISTCTHADSVAERGIRWFINPDGTILYYFTAGTYASPRFLLFQTVDKVKIGRNVIITTYNGAWNSASSAKIYINGKLAISNVIFNNLVASDSMIYLSSTGFDIGVNISQNMINPFFHNGQIRKVQLINRVATPAEVRKAFNLGTFEGIIPDANFLLDVDFNKTGTAAPTTRAGTPTYAISNFGATSYASYY